VLTSPQDNWRIKRQEFEKWIEKEEKKNFGPIRGCEKKKVFLKQKIITRRVSEVCERRRRWGFGGAEDSGSMPGRVCMVGWVGEVEDFNKCGVGREGGRGGVQTCERDGRWRSG